MTIIWVKSHSIPPYKSEELLFLWLNILTLFFMFLWTVLTDGEDASPLVTSLCSVLWPLLQGAMRSEVFTWGSAVPAGGLAGARAVNPGTVVELGVAGAVEGVHLHVDVLGGRPGEGDGGGQSVRHHLE